MPTRNAVERTVVLGILFALLIVFVFVPFYRAILDSLTDWDGFSDPVFIGIENYRKLLFEDPAFREALWHVSILTAVFVVQSVCVALGVAYLIHHLRSRRAKNLATVLVMVPSVAPTVAMYLLWSSFLQPNGLVNVLLRALGLGSLEQDWLGDGNVVLAALMLVGFPWLNGLNTLILLSGFLAIDRNLYEAASIEGAGRWAIFRYVELPALRPQISLLALIGVIIALQNYEVVFLLTQGGPGNSSTVPGMELYNNAFRYGDFGYASAIGVILFAVILLVAALSRLASHRRGRGEHE